MCVMSSFVLAAREFGSGTPMVLISGIGSPASHLYPLAQALSSDYRVLVASFPGDGATPVYPGPYSPTIDSQLLVAALHERGIREAHLVGFSGGGYRALALALGDQVRALSLVSLAGFASMPEEMREGLRQSADAVRAESLPGSALVPRFLTPPFAAAHPSLVAEVSGWIAAHKPEGLAQQLYAAADWTELSSRVGELRAPVVARSGELDVAVPYALNAQLASAAKSGIFELVPDVGHLLLFQDLEGTIASIRRAVSRVPARNATRAR